MSAYAPGTSAPDRLPTAVDRVLRVPDRHRTFGKDAAFAHGTWAIGPELLEELLDHGLPHRGEGGARRFERTDLHNVSTYLNLPSPYFEALGRRVRALTEASRAGRGHTHDLEITASCPDPGHPGACDFTTVPALATGTDWVPVTDPASGNDSGSLRESAPGVFAARCQLPSDTHVFDDERTELLSRVADWELYVLPDGIIEDEAFSRDTRLANCLIPTRMLLREAAERGLPARHGAGLLVAPPFTTLHHWIEFDLDGTWVPADPVLLGAFARWGMTDPGEWPWNRSVAGAVLPLLTWPPEVFFPLVLHRGKQADIHITAR